MMTKVVWFSLLWFAAGLICSYWVQRLMIRAEKEIEEGNKDLLPPLLALYTLLDASPKGSLQFGCIVAWPYILYAVLTGKT